MTAMPSPPVQGGDAGLRAILGAITMSKEPTERRPFRSGQSSVPSQILAHDPRVPAHNSLSPDVLRHSGKVLEKLRAVGGSAPISLLAAECGIDSLHVVAVVSVLQQQELVSVEGAPGHESVSVRG
jgi:hypothetical protein